MAYTTTSYGRPIQGVSQQPDRIRLEGQCTLQENCIPDVVKGLTRRPAANLIGRLSAGISSLCKMHDYDRGDEAYFMHIEPNSNTVKVYDLQGRAQTVTGTAAYLSVANPSKQLDMITVGDYTFITNRTKNVAMTSAVAPTDRNRGIVYVQYATYGKVYKIFVNGVTVASMETPDGADSYNIDAVATDYVTSYLVTQINGGTLKGQGGVADLDATASTIVKVVSRQGNVMVIERIDGADFTLTTQDSQAGQDLVAVKGAVKTVSSLPSWAPTGFIIRISGEGKSTKDDYWLTAQNSTESTVRWVETVKPGSRIAFDATTMPYTLIRTSINASGIATFQLTAGAWVNRETGSDESNPLPSFIDLDNPLPIQATGIFQNRLFFLSGESFYTSRSSLFFNFWKETSQQTIDSDPLSGFADSDRVNNLYTYQVLNGDLVIFGDEVQLMVDGSKPVTQENLTLRQITAYPNNYYTKPQAAGENVFFAFNASGYTGVRELFTDSYTDTRKAFPITDYVSKYIPGNATQLLAQPNYNTMIIRTDKDEAVLYIYDWLWQGEQKVQSAWHKWTFDGSVKYVFYVGDKIYVVYNRDNSLWMDYMYILNDPESTGLNYSIGVDHRTEIDAEYNIYTGLYSFTLPYVADDPIFTISTGGYDEDIGSAVNWTKISTYEYQTRDKLSNKTDLKLIAGVKFKSRYQPTQPTVKDARDRVIGLDSIIMSNLFIHYELTGHFLVTVQDKWGDGHSYRFDGRWMGSPNNLIGSPVLENGTFRVPVRRRAEDMTLEISTDSHYPFTLRDMEMDGTFHQRGQRI